MHLRCEFLLAKFAFATIVIYIFAAYSEKWTHANELTRCCAGGARHHRERASCIHLNAVGSSQNCARAASICCLRASIEGACTTGVQYALRANECTIDLYAEIGLATKKECCECCMLAVSMMQYGHNCIAGVGFSATCLNSFNKCCQSFQNISTSPTLTIDGNTHHFSSESISIQGTAENLTNNEILLSDGGIGGDFLGTPLNLATCDGARCEHYCSVRASDNTTECSCKHGYDLAADGHSCVDIDECVSFGTALCPHPNTQCLNFDGSFSCVCQHGFYWNNEVGICVDIDECLLLVDNCLESQRCLNTPGSYKCIRTLSCGTGYALDSETEQCVDVDECTLGAHNCGSQYQCRNTQGSYRCTPRTCAPNELLNQATGNCDSIECPPGYMVRGEKCEDIDECQTSNQCNFFDECINLPGSFRCQEKGNLCSSGFFLDRESGFCLDRNECEDGTHTCDTHQCINMPGTFKCRCTAGFEFNETTHLCEDVNECEKFAGHSCSLQAICENTIGSFLCHCNAGYKLAEDGRKCDDIDECSNGLAKCQQKCVNTPGSYQCICDRGYQLSANELNCEDIDECAIWAKSGNNLCMGECINTKGSFACSCPAGYQVLADNITCKDIDECAFKSSNMCLADDELCVNTLGSYKCQRMDCPKNYVRDKNYKNRCVRKTNFCVGPFHALERCRRMPLHISWQHIAIPRHVNISTQRTSVTLFSMKGPNSTYSNMQFELRLVDAKPVLSNVTPAVRGNFLLQKGEHHNSAIIALRDSLDGPQEIHLELVLRLSTNGQFNGKYVANLIIYVSQFRSQIQFDGSLGTYEQHSHRHHQDGKNDLTNAQ